MNDNYPSELGLYAPTGCIKNYKQNNTVLGFLEKNHLYNRKIFPEKIGLAPISRQKTTSASLMAALKSEDFGAKVRERERENGRVCVSACGKV